MAINKQIVCSFSGGETSAYMAIKLKEKYPDTAFVFANTGQENEETLEFVEMVDKFYGLNVTWLEAVVNPEKGKGTGYKVVNFETASRNGEPFEAVIAKYGVPNAAFLHCTRELKLSPVDRWQKEIHPNKLRAVGIRSDEIDRIPHDYKERGNIYPLAFWWPTTKNEINRFWDSQAFRLSLKHYEGNCTWCYKKSFQKLAWICKENPEIFDFPERMEKEYGFIGAKDGVHNTIFRGNRSTKDIREMALTATEPRDDARIYEVNEDMFGFDEMAQEFDACGSESCEAF